MVDIGFHIQDETSASHGTGNERRRDSETPRGVVEPREMRNVVWVTLRYWMTRELMVESCPWYVCVHVCMLSATHDWSCPELQDD